MRRTRDSSYIIGIVRILLQGMFIRGSRERRLFAWRRGAWPIKRVSRNASAHFGRGSKLFTGNSVFIRRAGRSDGSG